MAKAMVRTDNMSGTTLGKDLVSLRYSADIENGNVLAVGDYEGTHREVRAATAPGASTPLTRLALVASEEVMKRQSKDGLGDFINEAGSIIRGYKFTPGDIFSVTKEALAAGSATPAVGLTACIQSSTKMTLAAVAVGTTIGVVTQIENEWIVIEVR